MEEKFKYRHGFLLGKFMPTHEGHLHLVREAKKHAEHLTVLVCSVDREPIPGYLRYEWMKRLAPFANVVHITEEVPSYPHEHPDFTAIWTDLLKRYIHPQTDVVFSAEPYGDDIATWLGIDHIRLDKAFGTSGTNIRTAPFSNWQHIPSHVKPYFTKRVVLTGPESTGKTWMAQQLAKHYGTVWVPEYGREHFVMKHGNITVDDISMIAAMQLQREDEAAKRANRILFCDTDLIVTQVWSEIYFDHCPEWILEVNHRKKYDLFLLMDIDLPWENDGTREFPHLREFHFNRLKHELEKRHLDHVVISGRYEDRLRNAIEAVNSRFGADLFECEFR